MKVISAARMLWLRRRFVVLTLALACLIGVAIPYRLGLPPSLTSRQHRIGVASASALVDSMKSQVADLGLDTGSDVITLSARAALLGSIMANPPITDNIARLAGVAPKTLIATPPLVAGAAASPAPSVPSGTLPPSDPRANLVSVSVLESGQLPIIQINTQAATPAKAARLANASIAALEQDVNAVAASDQVPEIHRLVIRPLGPASVGSVTRGPEPLYGLLAAIAAFMLGCAAIIGVPALRETWRKASKDDALATGRPQPSMSATGRSGRDWLTPDPRVAAPESGAEERLAAKASRERARRISRTAGGIQSSPE